MITKAEANAAERVLRETAPAAPEVPMPAEFHSVKDRMLLGEARRKVIKRAQHRIWRPEDRRLDPFDLLDASTRGRLHKLVEIKKQRMACSPFGYFRGAVPVMAYDLSLSANTGIHTQLCGDAHVRNLGAFAGPDGRLVFDINDFDETIFGPFEWDVKRMATSLILAGREANIRGTHCCEAAFAFVARYRRMMHLFSRMPILDVVRFQVRRLGEVGPVSEILLAAQRSTPRASLLALTESSPHHRGQRIFKTIEPTLRRLHGEEAKMVAASRALYTESIQPERARYLAQYRLQDAAFKVVGTGSVGLRDYCLYLEGNGAKDPLFLQIKEETLSAYAPYLPESANRENHQGRRVIEGERAMQLQSDPFLGWTKIDGRDYIVRQLNDHKGSLDMTTLKAAGLMEYAAVCGELLARGHARGGDYAMIAGYLGNSDRFEEAVGQFAESYADQTERDWEQLVRSLKQEKTTSKR